MIKRRNGACCVAFDNCIFVFGGNNQINGSLDTIERYTIEFDKWSMPRVKLREPLHDCLCFNAGGGRVMIFGGMNAQKPNERIDLYDLSNECRAPEETTNRTGKVYLPPVYDPSMGLIHTFLGYGDTELIHHSFKV